MKRVLVWGCGSIGSRRAWLLAKMRGIEVDGYDIDEARAARATNGRAVSWLHVKHVMLPYDAVFICTPPDAARLDQVRWAVDRKIPVFVEKPTTTDWASIVDLAALARTAADEGLVTMGACNLRFCGVSALRKVKGSPKYGKFVMGQHAKFWSPGHQPISMALDSIHELDLAAYCLGPIESVRGVSKLNVAHLSVHHKDGNWSQILLDRQHEPPIRMASVESTEDAALMKLKTGDSMYHQEMLHFLHCVESGTRTMNPLVDAVDLCRVALGVCV